MPSYPSYKTGTVYYFYCMKPVLKPILHLRNSYSKSIAQKQPLAPTQLNLALASNPVLKGQEKYKLLMHEMSQYNKRVSKGEVNDEYEALTFGRLLEVVAEIGHMQVRKGQMRQIFQAEKWWAEQRRIIKQRKDLGIVKYKTDKKIDRLREYRSRMANSMILEEGPALPNEVRYAEELPFQMKYRTAHREMDLPTKRLPEYKRKIINISEALLDEPPVQTSQTVTYPRPKKIVAPQEIRDQANPQVEATTVEQAQPVEGQTNPPENTNPQATAAVESVQEANKQAEQANIQDFGQGLGEQPGQAEQEGGEQEAVQDKLAPKNKIYTWSIHQREEQQKEKTYERPYLFYRGHDKQAERNMQQRVIRRQQHSLQLQREEQHTIQKAHEWAAQKSRVDRQIMHKLQTMTANRSFSLSFELPQKRQMLSAGEEKKYGLTLPVRVPPGGQLIQLQTKLPQIAKVQPLERVIRKDRLNSLKQQFSKILSLRENSDPHQISNPQTMCLFQSPSSRPSLSMILEQHSLEREKASELQEIQKIKESLGKQRINVNIRTLAQALVPNSDSYRLEKFESPPKLLPNNPFFVEPKKKKKK